mmetsp:Transcript_27694/g.52092  ORF Transcript_27694/g.52092 Transcript_27694/m.52092 type:complete len:550 (+) Transcript_27694:81-1730(+)
MCSDACEKEMFTSTGFSLPGMLDELEPAEEPDPVSPLWLASSPVAAFRAKSKILSDEALKSLAEACCSESLSSFKLESKVVDELPMLRSHGGEMLVVEDHEDLEAGVLESIPNQACQTEMLPEVDIVIIEDHEDLGASMDYTLPSQASLAENFQLSKRWLGSKEVELRAGACASLEETHSPPDEPPVVRWDLRVADGVSSATLFLDVDGTESTPARRESIVSAKIQEFIEAKVEGPQQENLMLQHWPLFTLLQTAVVLVLWLVTFFSEEPDTQSGRVGLDALRPGSTDLRVHTDCQDHRREIYRLLSYQFTHVDARHVLVNAFLSLFLGIPLEGFHGSLRTMTAFNAGVFGGACCFLLFDIHASVVGMSAGCYAFMGMHLGDLLMNWAQRKYRRPLLLVIVAATAFDVLNAQMLDPLSEAKVSHSVHLGGYVSGLCWGILFGRNLVVKKWEQHLQVVVGLTCAFLIAFTLSWGQAQAWPPRTIFEASAGTHGWCWTRQVSNQSLFGDSGWHCVRCYTADCIARWRSESSIEKVHLSACEQNGGWAFSET